MSEQHPSSKETTVSSPAVTQYLGRKSIDAATLPWNATPIRTEDSFPPIFAFTEHATTKEARIVFTAGRIVNGEIEFTQYPPELLVYTEPEWDAFIEGVIAGEFRL